MSNDVTLAICAYNAERYIAETLRCVIAQSFQAFDLLIINDCSTDETVATVKQTLDGSGREYKIVNFEHNMGLAAARAYVEKNTTTKYILFVDADDLPLPALVEKLYNKITSDSDLMAVGCYQKFIDENGREIGGGLFMGSKTKDAFYKRAQNEKLIFMQPTAIIDRQVVNSVGGRNTTGFGRSIPRYQDLCEDLDLWCRMSDLYAEGKAIVVVPEVLLMYRKHSKSLTLSSVNMQLRMKHIKTNLKRRRKGEKELTFTKFRSSITPEQLRDFKRKSIAIAHLREGVKLFMKGHILKGGGLITKSFFMNPRYFWQKIKANSGLFK
ncbi:MAG: glycosyltransferase family 2 protein [Rikenellaceae bacterium]